MAVVYPYVDGTAFTEDGSKGTSAWQLDIMSPVTGATETVAENKYTVDAEGRISSYYISAARTATPTAYTVYSRGASGVSATMVVTAITASPSITMAIQVYDPISATWVSLLTSAAIVGTGTTRLTVSPYVVVAANVSASTTIGDTIRILVTHSDTDSITYTVGLEWIP